MTDAYIIAGILLYLLGSRLAVRSAGGPARNIVFAALNLAAVYFFLFYGNNLNYNLRFGIYLALVFFQYLMMNAFAQSPGWKPWLAFFTPILALLVLRYVPGEVYNNMARMIGRSSHGGPTLVGLSYLAFRSSHLILEVRNGMVKKPNLWEYLGFCFFLPTMSVGPINPYSNHCKAFESSAPAIPVDTSLMRILVGLVKYLFLGTLCNRLGYAGLLQDDHFHPWMDLPVAMIFYYLYLYCNFSGFCDVAIGAAGLIGIPVAENFQNPFAARNVKDFWNRWHITLSHYMRDMVFSPLSKFSVRLVGAEHANHAIAFTIAVVFLLVGVWHGVGWNFAAYGAAHALAVVTNHYYTIALKKWLGRDGFKAYNANPWIHAVAVALTFFYCAATLFFFANTFPQMEDILCRLR